ncbi:MAG: hypothetical protein GIW95_02175 [Candidatus Eremiobacteraeota bacterium]|nr:hypothetical protein [Candidatus Eremiobacteraeota bacterium]
MVAVSDGLVYPFGSLSKLRATLRAPHACRRPLPSALSRFRRKLRAG